MRTVRCYSSYVFVFACVAIFFTDSYAADNSTAPETVNKSLDKMVAGQKTIRAELQKAKVVKSVSVYACMEKKAQIADRLVVVAQRLANKEYKSAATKNDVPAKIKYTERIYLAQTGVDNLVPSTIQCWCEDHDAMNRTEGGAELLRKGELCGADSAQQSVVSLKVPEGSEDYTPMDQDLADIDANYGFPEIPPASPFR